MKCPVAILPMLSPDISGADSQSWPDCTNPQPPPQGSSPVSTTHRFPDYRLKVRETKVLAFSYGDGGRRARGLASSASYAGCSSTSQLPAAQNFDASSDRNGSLSVITYPTYSRTIDQKIDDRPGRSRQRSLVPMTDRELTLRPIVR